MSVYGLDDYPDFVEPALVQKELDDAIRTQITKDTAARIVQELRAREDFKGFDVLSPDQLYALESPAVKFRIADLWPTDGTLLCAAQSKAGKTVLSGNVTHSLVTGEPFLGSYAVRPLVDGEDVLFIVNNELEDWQYKELLEKRGTPAGHSKFMSVHLRDRPSVLNLMDKTIWKYWVEKLNHCGPDGRPATMLMVDPLGPMLRAMGRNENSNEEVGPVMDMLNELRSETSIREIFIIHHMGHDGGRDRVGGSRGASVLNDVPTALWDYKREKEDDQWSPRIFNAVGRSGTKANNVKVLFNEDNNRLYVEGSDKITSAKVNGRRIVTPHKVSTRGVA